MWPTETLYFTGTMQPKAVRAALVNGELDAKATALSKARDALGVAGLKENAPNQFDLCIAVARLEIDEACRAHRNHLELRAEASNPLRRNKVPK